MQRSEFFNLITGIFRYFRFKETPPATVIDDWHTDLKYIDSNAVGYVSDKLKENDSLPRNIPKIIKKIYMQYQRENKDSIFVRYDPIEDLRFPIDKLYTAQEIYIKSGRDSFLEYCNTNYMPATDRERVENKVKHLIEIGKVEGFIAGVAESIKDYGKPPSQIEKSQEAARQRKALQDDIPF